LAFLLFLSQIQGRTTDPRYIAVTMRGSVFAAVLVAMSTAVHVPEVAWKKAFDFAPSESHPHAGVEAHDGGFLMVSLP